MAKLKELYKPSVRNRASICSWTLEFKFLTREQCLKFINLYLNEIDYSDNVSYRAVRGDSVILDEHYVTIENMTWAGNLTKVGKLLEKCDYQME